MDSMKGIYYKGIVLDIKHEYKSNINPILISIMNG